MQSPVQFDTRYRIYSQFNSFYLKYPLLEITPDVQSFIYNENSRAFGERIVRSHDKSPKQIRVIGLWGYVPSRLKWRQTVKTNDFARESWPFWVQWLSSMGDPPEFQYCNKQWFPCFPGQIDDDETKSFVYKQTMKQFIRRPHPTRRVFVREDEINDEKWKNCEIIDHCYDEDDQAYFGVGPADKVALVPMIPKDSFRCLRWGSGSGKVGGSDSGLVASIGLIESGKRFKEMIDLPFCSGRNPETFLGKEADDALIDDLMEDKSVPKIEAKRRRGPKTKYSDDVLQGVLRDRTGEDKVKFRDIGERLGISEDAAKWVFQHAKKNFPISRPDSVKYHPSARRCFFL